jgi:hypothetical protein
MDVFKIANYVGYLHCDSAVKIAFPVVQAVFILVQVRTQVLTSQMELPLGDMTETTEGFGWWEKCKCR